MTISLYPLHTHSLFLSPSSQSHRIRIKNQTPIQVSPTSQTPSNSKTGVIVIGAGLAGLAAALHLNSQNIPFLLLEASDGVGGRVRTDKVDGFLLDRGFQIFITAYPEAKRILDYQALDLRKFYSGARVFYNGEFHNVADPIRHFGDSLKSLTNPVGSVMDKLLIGFTRLQVLIKSDEQILEEEEKPTMDLLREIGFSDSIITSFFRPFLGGIFFDTQIQTTSRLFNFIFKCLALGDNTLPANGIEAIPKQLASKLPANSILLNSKVDSIQVDASGKSSVTLQTGKILRSELGVVVAVEEPEAVKLLAGRKAPSEKKPVRSTVCLYFSAERDQIPTPDPVLFLNGSGKGIVNNMLIATNVSPSYGPPDKALVSASLIGLFEGVSDQDLTAEVIQELSSWFGPSMVTSWKHLKTYRVGFAQPNQCPPTNFVKNPKSGPGLYVCGDYMASATFDGAFTSGRRAAEALLKEKEK